MNEEIKINENEQGGEKKRTSPLAFLRNIQAKISSSQYSYLIYCFFVPVVIMYMVYVAMEIHPFGENSVLVLDLNGQYVYFFEALRNFIRGDASLLYSFSRAAGGEFMGIYAYYLASPLSYLVALFPTERMLEALLVIILLKVGLCGTTFGYYLHKNSKAPNKFIVIAFSIMYSLCAYAVVYQNNVMWMDALIWLPLITYGIEQLIKFGKYKLFVISLAVAVMSNFYIGYMLCIWVAIYFFYYYYSRNDGRNNPTVEKNHFLRSFIRIGIFSAIAIAISAVIILSTYYSLSLGKNDFSNPNWAFQENFNILDFLTKFLAGSYDTVRPEGLPNVYGGMLMLLLIPVYFVSKKISSREKIASLFVILFFVLFFISRPLDLIWHGFQRPNWLNYRYSFIFVFFLLTLAYRGFGNLRKVGEKFILGVGAVIVIFIAVCQKLEFETYVESESKLLTLETVWLSILAVIAFVALLCLTVKLKNVFKRENVCCVLTALVCLEIFCSSLACVVQHDKDVVYSGYDGYNDFLSELRPIVNTIEENDTSFYRYEKMVHRKLNDNMALGIRGLSNSTSTLNATTINFLHQMGYASTSHWSKYLGGNPVNDSIMGIKYIINDGYSISLSNYYSIEFREEDAVAYLNPYALSIAYGVDSSIYAFDMSEQISHLDRLNSLVGSMLGEEEQNIFVPIETEKVSLENCSKSNSSGHIKYTATSSGSKARITYTITALSDDEIFVHIPADYSREASLTVNKAYIGKILGNETNRIISLGSYKQGEVLQVELTIENDYNNLYAKDAEYYFYHLDKDAFETAFGKLLENPQFVVSEGHSDDRLEGTITTVSDAQTILTTIPYDENWRVYLDGEEIEYTQTLDAVIAFDIDTAGEHTLKLVYSSAPFTRGLTISFIGLAVFIIICGVELVIKIRRKKNGAYTPLPDDILWELEDFDTDAEDYLNTRKEDTVKPKTTFKSLFSKKNDTSSVDNENNDEDNGGI